MAAMLAKTPLSKCAKPFVPYVDASPIVAWMPVFLATDAMVRSSESSQKAGFADQIMEAGEAELRSGRARTRDFPSRIPLRTPSPSGFSVCLSEASTSDGSLSAPTASIANVSSFSDSVDYEQDLQGMDTPPVKNTFVHFNKEHLKDFSGERNFLSRSFSAPSIVLTRPFKHFTMADMHERGQCNPCAYFYAKKDGCRLGSECKFCHLCPSNEIKNRKKQRSKELKARKLETR